MISKFKDKFDYTENINNAEYKLQKDNHKIIKSNNYINQEKAILKLNNNQKLYFDILWRTAKNYESAIDEIGKMMHKKQYLKIDDKLHELKGICGSIGAEKLYDNINKFRDDLKEKNYEIIERNFSEFYKCYKETFNYINEIIGNIKEENIVELKNKVQTNNSDVIIKDIMKKLEEGSVEAVDLFNENKLEIEKFFDEDEIKKLEKSIESYDMEKALSILESR